MEFSQKFIGELLKIFEVTGKVTTTGLKYQVPEDQKVQCDKVIHQKYRSAVGKLLWMAQLKTTSSIPSRSFQDLSSIPKIRTSRILFTCSSMSIRPETLSLSWSLSFQSGIKRASFRFKLSASLIQIGQVVKSQSQQAVHWFQYSMSTFSRQVEPKLQSLIHQQKVSSTQ